MSSISTVTGPPIHRVFHDPAEWTENVGKVPEEQTKFGMRFFGKDLSHEPPDGPWAKTVMFPPGFENNPHFHSAPQFQVLLEGSVAFPTHELTAPAVHYADAFSPYGPFTCGEGFKIMVVRPWLAKKYNMSNRSTRGLRDPYGRNMYAESRELYGQANDASWTRTDGTYDSQQLLGTPTDDQLDGPMAELVRLDPGSSITNNALITRFGLFVIVFAGALAIAGETLEPYSAYFARGVDGEPMVAGGDGATILRCAFEEQADLSRMPTE
jgi:hypothetical protein